MGSHGSHGVALEGPVRGVANWQARAGQGYDLPHFTIDWDHERVTCPQGKVSVSWRPARNTDGSPRICAQFSRSDCGACAARTLCTQTGRPRRHVYFHPRAEHEALTAARARMSDPAWAQRHEVRAGVEGTLLQGVRAFGMRRSAISGWRRPGFSRSASPPR